MELKTKTFDAVAESRKWKESTAHETEGMTFSEVLEFFDAARVNARFLNALGRSRQQITVEGRSPVSGATTGV